MRALFTAATGMEAQQLRIDTVANNLANVNTTGFKRSRADFQDLFYETLRAPGAAAADGTLLPTGAQVGHGVKLAAVTRNYSPGERATTNRDLDVAIDGDGFFQFTDANGQTVYSRDGGLQLDSTGNIVNSQGLQMIPAINVPVDAIQVTIREDGTVSTLVAGDTDATDQGQIQLARFANPSGLRAVGNNLVVPSASSGAPETGSPNDQGFGATAQGFLEASNVNMAEELVRMIVAQRAFEVNSRVIQAGDEMLRTASQLSG